MRSWRKIGAWTVGAGMVLVTGCNLGTRTEATVTSTFDAVPPTRTSDRPLAQTCADSADEMVSSEGGLTVCFLDLNNGDSVAVSAATPEVRLTVEAAGRAVAFIDLAVDGTFAASAKNVAEADPFRAELVWTPAVAGAHVLSISTMTNDKTAFADASVRVNVIGEVSGAVPTAGVNPSAMAGDSALTPDAASQSRLRNALQANFHEVPPFPAIARKSRPGVDSDPWVTTMFLPDRLHQLYVFPDGHDEVFSDPIHPASGFGGEKGLVEVPLCRPAGEYTLLVVFVDYGNLGVTREDVQAALRLAEDSVNEAFAWYPSGMQDGKPILQLRAAAAFVEPSAASGKMFLTPEDIARATGLAIGDYSWLAQVDLDAENHARRSMGPGASFGYAARGCSFAHTAVNIWMAVDEKSQLTGLDNRFAGTLLSHEVLHLFGYDAQHRWPCTDGPTVDPADQCGYQNWPALMLGWIDTDGDGIVEILDPTPYGLTLP